MSYQALGPKSAVVLFTDLQRGIIELSATVARLRRAVSALAKLAGLFEAPAIVTSGPSKKGAPQATADNRGSSRRPRAAHPQYDRAMVPFWSCLGLATVLSTTACQAGQTASLSTVIVLPTSPRTSLHTEADSLDLARVLEPLREKYDFPALAGAIVSDERTMALGVVGVRKEGTAKHASREDPFHLGSNTKAMTAIVIARAVEAGKLSWSTTIGEVFSEVKVSRPFLNVTVEELLAMRGGFSRDPKIVFSPDFGGGSAPLADQRRMLVASALSESPEIEPHTTFSYSNTSYVIAAAMAERATGLSWEELIQSEVWAPLTMTTGGFGAPGSSGAVDAPWGHGLAFGMLTPISGAGA